MISKNNSTDTSIITNDSVNLTIDIYPNITVIPIESNTDIEDRNDELINVTMQNDMYDYIDYLKNPNLTVISNITQENMQTWQNDYLARIKNWIENISKYIDQ